MFPSLAGVHKIPPLPDSVSPVSSEPVTKKFFFFFFLFLRQKRYPPGLSHTSPFSHSGGQLLDISFFPSLSGFFKYYILPEPFRFPPSDPQLVALGVTTLLKRMIDLYEQQVFGGYGSRRLIPTPTPIKLLSSEVELPEVDLSPVEISHLHLFGFDNNPFCGLISTPFGFLQHARRAPFTEVWCHRFYILFSNVWCVDVEGPPFGAKAPVS